MRNRALVFTDLSDHSHTFLNLCSIWAKKSQIEMVWIHILNSYKPVFMERDVREHLSGTEYLEAQQKLQTYKNEFAADLNHIQTYVSQTGFKQTIEYFLKQDLNQCLVFGAKEKGVFQRVTLGSTVNDVIKFAEVPVITIPKQIERIEFPTVYIGVNRISPINIIQLDNLLKFLGHSVQKLVFFSISQEVSEQFYAERYLKQLSRHYKNQVVTDYKLYPTIESITQLKDSINADTDELLVFQRDSFWYTDSIFKSFIVPKLILEGKTPLAVIG